MSLHILHIETSFDVVSRVLLVSSSYESSNLYRASEVGSIRQRASRAAPAWNRSRSYAGHLHHGTAGAVARASATRQMVEPVSLRQGSRPSRGSAALALPTRGFSAGRVGETARLVAHACAAGVAVVKKVALPSGGANAHDVFAAGGSSIGGARRGSSARVTSCLPCSIGYVENGCVLHGALCDARRRPRRRAGCERGYMR